MCSRTSRMCRRRCSSSTTSCCCRTSRAAPSETRQAMADLVFDNLHRLLRPRHAEVSRAMVRTPRALNNHGDVMRENRLRTLWKSGGAAVNGWLAIPNSFSAETMAHQGWDSLTIDLQHGVVDYQAMVDMLQAISTTADRAGGARALARARHPDEGARRRRLRRDLPDGQHARGRAEAGRLDALRAARHAQLRPGARAALRRRRLSAARQRHDRHLRDDRDRAGARQPRRHPVGRGARRDLHRPVGPVARARLHADLRRRRPEGGRRRSTTSWSAPRRTASSPASTTAAPRRRWRASPRASSSSPSAPTRG